jgi:hypothetical protein
VGFLLSSILQTKMILRRCFLLALASVVAADQANYYDDAYNANYNANGDDQAAADDAYAANGDDGAYQQDDAYAANGDDGAQQQDDVVADDDAADQYYYANLNQDNGYFSAGDDYIKYWTDYAILPKRCIV